MRTTPGFPTPNHRPAVKFNDSLFEAFNAAAGSVMQAYGNLFQGRQNAAFTTARHAFKAGIEVRVNRDTTTSASAPTANTTLAAAPPTPPKPSFREREAQHATRRSLAGYAFELPLRQPLRLHRGIAPPTFPMAPHWPAAISRNNIQLLFARHLEGQPAVYAGLTAFAGSCTIAPSPSAPAAPPAF
jgi:hypothetical protein